jgi:hypothetical protein
MDRSSAGGALDRRVVPSAFGAKQQRSTECPARPRLVCTKRLRIGTRALASGRKRTWERDAVSSSVPVDGGRTGALLVAKGRAADDDGKRRATSTKEGLTITAARIVRKERRASLTAMTAPDQSG